MRILIIEDDIHVIDSLRKSLEAECFAVDCSSDGETGSYTARINDYDAVILDLILPKKNGLQVCQDIRNAGKHMPIIIISIKGEPLHKIPILNAGADDYVPKPFSFEELLARLRAVLRRPKTIEDALLFVGDLSLDRNRQRVMRGEQEIYLTRKEFSLLEYLMRNKGNVVSRGMIMEHVWNSDSDPFSNTIEAHILNLRKKVDVTKERKLIYNVPGRGYKITDPYEY